MKLKFYILFALCFMLVNGASAQGYTGSRVGKTDTIMVTGCGDCSIPVSKFASALGVPVYGDVGYGGDGWCFEVVTKYKNKEPDLKGFAFEKSKENSSAIVNITFEIIKDSVTLNFCKAREDMSFGDFRFETFPVIFIKEGD